MGESWRSNRPVDLAVAAAITSIDKLLEVIVAPDFADDALAILKDRWKNVRLLQVGPLGNTRSRRTLHMHKIAGGFLLQERDLAGVDEVDMEDRYRGVHPRRRSWLI